MYKIKTEISIQRVDDRQLVFDHIRMGFSKVNANSRFPRVIMKKARSEEKMPKEAAGGQRGSWLREIPFESIPTHSRFRGARMHKASSCRAAMRVTSARGRMQFRHGDRKNSAHFTFMPRPVVLIPLVHALSFVILYFFFHRRQYAVDLRIRQRDSCACIDDDECITHCTYVHIRAHVATRSRGSGRVWITR